MILHIKPATDKGFHVCDNALHVLIGIEPEQSLEILGEPTVSTLLLTKQGADDVVFGFSRSITRLPGESITIEANHPLYIEIDALQHEDDLSDLTSGKYELKVSVNLFCKSASGEIKPTEFSKAMLVTLVR